jgi:hypothetical protein
VTEPNGTLREALEGLQEAASKFGARVFEREPSWKREASASTDLAEARDALTKQIIIARAALAAQAPQGPSGTTAEKAAEIAYESFRKLSKEERQARVKTIQNIDLAQRSDRGGEVTSEENPAVITADKERVISAQPLQTGRDEVGEREKHLLKHSERYPEER